jgi:hypothetical protein
LECRRKQWMEEDLTDGNLKGLRRCKSRHENRRRKGMLSNLLFRHAREKGD